MSTTTARLDVDQPLLGKAVTWGLGSLALVAFAAGYPSLVEVAQMAGVVLWAAFLVPFVVDGAMVLLGVSAMVQRHRTEPAMLQWTGMTTFVIVSVAAQAAHSLTRTTATGWVMSVGVVLACTPPVATLLAAESWLRMIVSAPRTKRTNRRPRASEPAPDRATPAAEPGRTSNPDRTTKTPRTTRPADQATRTIPIEDRSAVVAQAQQLLESGHSLRAVADQLKVSKTSLTRWLAAAQRNQDEEQEAA
ncbi:MAG: DUF2637 domain-containing protein [Propionicimonas sp.]